jgi:hypothetical protein
LKNVEECIIELIECHRNLRDFSADTVSAQAYAIVIRTQLDKLMEVINNNPGFSRHP